MMFIDFSYWGLGMNMHKSQLLLDGVNSRASQILIHGMI